MYLQTNDITIERWVEYVRKYNSYYTADGDTQSEVIFQVCYGLKGSAPGLAPIEGGCIIGLDLSEVTSSPYIAYEDITEEMLLEWCEAQAPAQIQSQKNLIIDRLMESSMQNEVELIRWRTPS
jgi:hypothetical protein